MVGPGSYLCGIPDGNSPGEAQQLCQVNDESVSTCYPRRVSRLEPTPDESLDHLVNGWKIFQLKRGHRFSTDDLAAAWRATEALPSAERVLDIGSGIGTVGLVSLHRLTKAARLTTVEVQKVSYDLQCRTIEFNGLSDRVTPNHGDLRDPEVLPPGASFDLITGSPPYIPRGKGLESPIPQRAGARIELRGSVFDYCEAARRWLAPGGRFCYVMLAADPRTEEAPLAHGLVVLERYEYVFREGRPAHIATMVCAREEDGPFPARREGLLTIRDRAGNWTAAYDDFREAVGISRRPARG